MDIRIRLIENAFIKSYDKIKQINACLNMLNACLTPVY